MAGRIQQSSAPSMSLEAATKGAGLVLDPLSGMYYQPSSGQFYQSGTFQNQSPVPRLIGFDQYVQFSQFGNRAKAQETPSNALNFGGYVFNPFTGNARGVTSGLFSPIDRYQPSPQTFEAPVGILNSLFGDIEFPSSTQSSGAAYGAGRFLGNSK